MATTELKTIVFAGKRSDILTCYGGHQIADGRTADALGSPNTGFGGLASGVTIHDQICRNRDDAEEYIRRYHEYPKTALAICFYAESVPGSRKRKWQAAVVRLDGKRDAFLQKLLNGLRGRKRPRVSCRSCKSTLSVPHLQSAICPVCSGLLATAGQAARLKKMDDELEELGASIRNTPDDPYARGPTHWLVGGHVWAADPELVPSGG